MLERVQEKIGELCDNSKKTRKQIRGIRKGKKRIGMKGKLLTSANDSVGHGLEASLL